MTAAEDFQKISWGCHCLGDLGTEQVSRNEQWEEHSSTGFCGFVSIRIKASYVRNVFLLCRALENALYPLFAVLLCHLSLYPDGI